MQRVAAVVVLCFVFAVSLLAQRPQEPMNAAEVQLALQKLGVVGNVLYIAAHPDDENTALLSYLSNQRLFRTAYLSVTRGDGGQNLIGTEKGPLLGVIRTQELLAARRVDGTEQFFTRAIDFGYSKTPEETFATWNKEEVLSDVVWVIRSFQPDVIITRFPTTGEGGHGHHTASAILAVEAFAAAADPKRFPQQLNYVKPWQAKRIFWNAFRRDGGGPPVDDPQMLSIDVGTYSRLLGRSHSEIAAESRTMHKSQGFGAAERRGSILNYFKQLGGDPITSGDLFQGIDVSWARVAGSERFVSLWKEAVAAYDSSAPEKSVPALLAMLNELEKLPADVHTDQKAKEIVQLVRGAGGIWIESIAAAPTATPGSVVRVTTTVVPRALPNVTLRSLAFTEEADRTVKHSTTAPLPAPLAINKATSIEAAVTLPEHVRPTHPYWLENGTEKGKGALYATTLQTMVGAPDDDPAMTAHVVLVVGDRELRYEVPVVHRSTHRVHGEQYRPFGITPLVVGTVTRAVMLFPDASTRSVDVVVENRGEARREERVSLQVPKGWKVTPESHAVALEKRGERKSVQFQVTPPSGEEASDLWVTFGGATAKTAVEIDYPHIPMQLLFPAASMKLVRADVKRTGKRIGYIEGPGDDVPQALEQIGFEVVRLTDEQYLTGDLSRFDAIVAGVRAFNTRDVLKESPQRIFDYVRGGGRFVAQYNTNDDTLAKQLAPFELTISRDRVTVEGSPVKLVAPGDALLNRPNRITLRDFEGWVQERGLYFPGKWAPEFRVVVSMSDPGEKELTSAILAAPYGKGEFIYTPLAFFRQLPEGVPGAYRLFANLVSAARRD